MCRSCIGSFFRVSLSISTFLLVHFNDVAVFKNVSGICCTNNKCVMRKKRRSHAAHEEQCVLRVAQEEVRASIARLMTDSQFVNRFVKQKAFL